jgi:hypothetical protein
MRWKLGLRSWEGWHPRPAILLATVALLAMLPSATFARDKDDFRALYDWTCEQGRLKKIERVAADLLGIPATSDIPALRKAYRDEATKIIYAFFIFSVNGVPKMAMFRMTQTLNVAWLVSEDGGPLRTAEVTTKRFGPVALDRYREYFLETKDYLLKERSHAVAEHALTGNCQAIPEFPGQ